jgi:hypothetical protein
VDTTPSTRAQSVPPDEIEAALERAEGKRRELEGQLPEAQQFSNMLSILPKAAELFRHQVVQGLNGNPQEAGKARVTLRGWFCGRSDLTRDGEQLWAEYGQQPAALLQVVGSKRLGNSGSGGSIRSLLARLPRRVTR